MSAGGMQPRPTNRRAVVIATVLSLLLPGLGHAYALRLTRALVWFAGTIAVFVVLNQGDEDTALALGMGLTMSVLAALDIVLVMWLDGRSRAAR
ncbi:MAG TPA: hypothetical protein VFG74_02150 [Miltoncostaeaceae bacterium]|nr:hypothetical protein [Miltoncostaeaceae bacterium]